MKNLLVAIMVCRFALPFWVGLPEVEKKKILLSTAIEFAQKCRGKAKAFLVVNPEDWTVEIHAEMMEVGI